MYTWSCLSLPALVSPSIWDIPLMISLSFVLNSWGIRDCTHV
jgi:hypothetical protein